MAQVTSDSTASMVDQASLVSTQLDNTSLPPDNDVRPVLRNDAEPREGVEGGPLFLAYDDVQESFSMGFLPNSDDPLHHGRSRSATASPLNDRDVSPDVDMDLGMDLERVEVGDRRDVDEQAVQDEDETDPSADADAEGSVDEDFLAAATNNSPQTEIFAAPHPASSSYPSGTRRRSQTSQLRLPSTNTRSNHQKTFGGKAPMPASHLTPEFVLSSDTSDSDDSVMLIEESDIEGTDQATMKTLQEKIVIKVESTTAVRLSHAFSSMAPS